jgi:hypothetical protein
MATWKIVSNVEYVASVVAKNLGHGIKAHFGESSDKTTIPLPGLCRD